MKKSLLFAAFLCLFSLAAPKAQAALPEYAETLRASGINATVSASWKLDQASERALLPVPAKGRLDAVSVRGAVAGQAEITRVNGETVLLVPLSSVSGPVEVTADWTVPDFFKHVVKSGGEGPSGRGDTTPLKYAIVNTTGLGFEKATLSLILPEGMRLFQAAGKNVTFVQKDDTYTVTKALTGKKGAPGLATGGKLDLDVTMMPPEGRNSLFLWAAVLAISAFSLYYRRDLIPGRSGQQRGAA